MTFDPTHEKLPDQPVSIGGDKSAAAWHPNSGPEVPHADWPDYGDGAGSNRGPSAALGDTVPRERYEALCREWADVMRLLTEARAERNALAHVIKQVRAWNDKPWGPDMGLDCADLRVILATAPAVSLTFNNLEVWRQGYEAGFERGVLVQSGQASGEPPVNPYRPVPIREEAK